MCMKIRQYFTIFALIAFSSIAKAQDHTHFLDQPLDLTPNELVEALEEKGLQQEDRYELSGRIAGLDVWLSVNVGKDSTKINHVLLTTQEQQGSNLHDDYATLRKWMQKHYGAPTWESTVRSHSFARWYVGYDRDIVMIATASAGVEIWFYENHQRRNIDYYAILKYCERNPAPDMPVMYARDNVTWKSTGDTSTVKKKVAKRDIRKVSKKKAKTTKQRRSKTVKSKKQRRKR